MPGFNKFGRILGVTEQTYFRWRKEYGGLRKDQARRLKELERENPRLKKAVADLTLDKLILKEAASGNFGALPVVGTTSIMSRRRWVFPNVAPAEFSARTVQPSGMLRRLPTTKRRSPKRSSILPVSLGVTAIAGSRPCCVPKGGMGMPSVWRGSGEERAKGAGETTQSWPALAQRWFLHPTSAVLAASCLGSRLCPGTYP